MKIKDTKFHPGHYYTLTSPSKEVILPTGTKIIGAIEKGIVIHENVYHGIWITWANERKPISDAVQLCLPGIV